MCLSGAWKGDTTKGEEGAATRGKCPGKLAPGLCKGPEVCVQKPEALDGAGETILRGSQFGNDTRARGEAGAFQARDRSRAGWIGSASESAGEFQDNPDFGTWVTNK